MRFLWIFLGTLLGGLLVSACASRSRTTVFYKSHGYQLLNTKGETCLQSGLILDEDHGTMIEYYSNCDLQIVRPLKPHELSQWPKKGATK